MTGMWTDLSLIRQSCKSLMLLLEPCDNLVIRLRQMLYTGACNC